MAFNKSNVRQRVLGTVAVAMIGWVLAGKLIHKEAQANTSVQPAPIKPDGPDFKVVENSGPAVFDDDDKTLQQLSQQLEKDHEQQRRIKDLKMQREETDLALEEQKALSQLNKLKNDNMVSVNGGKTGNDSDMDIKIMYLGGTNAQKEAILSVNGINYSVRPKDRPLKNLQVLSITDNAVTIHFLAPGGSTTTYQFKSE